MSLLCQHASGTYQFLPGGGAYCRGVIAAPGFEIVHVTFMHPLLYAEGIRAAVRYVEGVGRPSNTLCAIELRSPRPFSAEGFAEFNKGYIALLGELGLLADGKSPMTRTNVAPEIDPPSEATLYSFSYTTPSARPVTSFVASGAGDFGPDGAIRPGDSSAEGMSVKAKFVTGQLTSILNDLGVSWEQATHVNIYTIHPLFVKLLDISGGAGLHGAQWYYSRPPIAGLEYEADVRSTWQEIVI